MNNDINLIGSKNHDSPPPASRKLKLMRSIAMFLLFGVSGTAVVLYILIAFSPLPQVQEQEQQARATISRMHPEMTKIALLEDRLSGITAVLNERNNYDAVLNSLADKMSPEIEIFQISMKRKNLSMTVRSKTLEPLTKFISNLTQAANSKEYTTVTLNNIITDHQSNNFSLTFSISL